MLRCVVLCAVALLTFARADDVLHIGTLDVAPYGEASNDGKLKGVFATIAEQVIGRAGYSFEDELYPPARLYALLKLKAIDVAISSRNLDLDYGLVNLGKVGEMRGLIVYRADLPVAPKATTDFSPYLIGRLGGTCPTLARAHMRLYNLDDYLQGYRMLAAHRVDALCGESGALAFSWKQASNPHFPALKSFNFLNSDMWLFANPDMPAATQVRLREALNSMRSAGEIQRIISQEIPTQPLIGSGSP